MGITVKRAGGPSVMAAAAYGGGQGKRRAQAESKGASALSVLDRQRSSQKAQVKAAALRREQNVEDRNFNRAARVDDRERRLKFEADKAKWMRENQLADKTDARQFEANKMMYEDARSATAAAAEREMELADAERERGYDVEDRDAAIYQKKLQNLSPDARQKYNEKRAAFQDAIADGSLSPDQIEEARAQLDDDLKTLVLNDIPPLEGEQVFHGRKVGEAFLDLVTGLIGTQKGDGEVDYRPNPMLPTPKDISEWVKNMPKKTGPDGVEIAPSDEEIDNYVELMGWRRRKQVALSLRQDFTEPRPATFQNEPTEQTPLQTVLSKFTKGWSGDSGESPERSGSTDPVASGKNSFFDLSEDEQRTWIKQQSQATGLDEDQIKAKLKSNLETWGT